MDLAPISFQKHHDRATIGPRLGFDRGPRSPSIVVGSSRSDSAAKEVRSRLDRAMIVARSRPDRTAIVGFFHALSAPSDGALQVRWMVTIARHRGRQIAIESHSIHHYKGAPSPAVRSAKNRDEYRRRPMKVDAISSCHVSLIQHIT